VLGVGQTLELAARGSGFELFVVAAGATDTIPSDRYVDLDNLRIRVDPDDVSALGTADTIDLNALIDRQHEYLTRRDRDTVPSRDQLTDQFRRRASEAWLLLRLLEPDLVMVWNGMMSLRAVYSLVARSLGVTTVYLEKGMLPESFSIDTRGVNADSALAALGRAPAASEADRERWHELLTAIDAAGTSAWDQPERAQIDALRRRLGLAPGRLVVFFPGQVDHDSNVLCFSPDFHDTSHALRWLAGGLDPDRHVVLAKPHPKGRLTVPDMQHIIGEGGVATDNLNVLDAIALSDCVVSINSAVAFEAAIRNTPIVLLGRGVLSNQPFVVNFQPDTRAACMVDVAVERFRNRREELADAAADLGVYLMTDYYGYRDDLASARRLIERHLADVPRPAEKRLTAAELGPVVRPISADEIAARLGGRQLLRRAVTRLATRVARRRTPDREED
jgi:hypothetical protein